MSKRLLGAILIAAAISAVGARAAEAVTPANGGDVGGTGVTIDDGPGDQSEPNVGGNLAVYTDRNGIFMPGQIRYFDFVSGLDAAVPAGAPGDSDILADSDGRRIVFSRTRASDNATSVMLFDVASGGLTEIDPQGPDMMRFGAKVAADSVVFAEFAFLGGDIHVHDAGAGTTSNVSQSPLPDMNPSLSPSGDVVVWERCIGSNCDIFQSLRTGGMWSAPAIVAATVANESNPDTDGTTVVYDSGPPPPGAFSPAIHLRSVTGGSEIALDLPGIQRNPSISAGVFGFESKATTETPADLFVYVIATNTVYRVTSTPSVDETLNDLSVLPSGVVHLVWAADDDAEHGLHNVYARSFSVPLTADAVAPVLSFPAAVTVDATSPAGATVTYAVSATDEVDPSPTVGCTPASGATFAIGVTAVACTASDDAGNTAVGSFVVTVLGANEQLARLVQDVVAASTLPPLLKAQLLARFQPLLAAFDPANPVQRRAVCGGLNAFVALVRLLSGYGIPPAQAAAWIADANRIRAVLGCA